MHVHGMLWLCPPTYPYSTLFVKPIFKRPKWDIAKWYHWWLHRGLHKTIKVSKLRDGCLHKNDRLPRGMEMVWWIKQAWVFEGLNWTDYAVTTYLSWAISKVLHLALASLPSPHPAFCHLQHGKAGENLVSSSCEHDVIRMNRQCCSTNHLLNALCVCWCPLAR